METITVYSERALTSATYYWDAVASHLDIMHFFHTVVALRFQQVHDRERYVEICTIAPACPDALHAHIQYVLTATQSRRDVVAYHDVEDGVIIRYEDRIKEFAWKCADHYYLVHFSHDDDLYRRK